MISLVYGAPHAGKSTMLAFLCKQYIAEYRERTGLDGVVRVVTAETFGAYKSQIKAGNVALWPIYLRQHPWQAMGYAVQGYWPIDPKDPKSLLAPFPSDGMHEGKKILAYIFEGCSTFGELLIGSAVEGGLAARASRGEIVGNIKKEVIQFQDGNTADGKRAYQEGTNSGFHYSIVQRRVSDYVDTSKALPVDTWWSSHEGYGEDKTFHEPKIGPLIVGSSGIDTLPKRFGTVLYLRVRPDAKNQPEYRVYLKKHFVVVTRQEWGESQPTTSRVEVFATLREEMDVDMVSKVPEYLKVDAAGVKELMKLINEVSREN